MPTPPSKDAFMKVMITSDLHWGFNGSSTNMIVMQYLLSSFERDKPDILIVAGDNSSTSFDERYKVFTFLRDRLGKGFPILTVNGNHDFWVHKDEDYQRAYNVEDVYRINLEIYGINNIRYLPENPFINDEIAISGMDGWYIEYPDTNDKNWIPGPFNINHSILRTRSSVHFEKAIKVLDQEKDKGKKTILVSHFPFTYGPKDTDWKAQQLGKYFGDNLSYSSFIDNVDYLIYGHTHTFFDAIDVNGKTRVVNTGSDYNDPHHLTLEI